ncbi:Ail/Lom family outer membrane beta-barrel protein, partial [Escherichia coli]|nr:Ail/Lom family outer membrane beta-barrel protein [Escherichia coli]
TTLSNSSDSDQTVQAVRLRFSESNSTKKNSLAWAAGAQFNLNESVTLDVAYEGSGSGDWRTSGVTAGIGLKF